MGELQPQLRVLNLGAGVQSTTHSDEYWGRLKRESPAEWADTVAVDKAVRNAGLREQFLHRSCQPLDEVLLPGDDGQMELFAADGEGSGNECTGYCWT